MAVGRSFIKKELRLTERLRLSEHAIVSTILSSSEVPGGS